jgi:hypothetical protein
VTAADAAPIRSVIKARTSSAEIDKQRLCLDQRGSG